MPLVSQISRSYTCRTIIIVLCGNLLFLFIPRIVGTTFRDLAFPTHASFSGPISNKICIFIVIWWGSMASMIIKKRPLHGGCILKGLFRTRASIFWLWIHNACQSLCFIILACPLNKRNTKLWRHSQKLIVHLNHLLHNLMCQMCPTL